MARAYHSSSSTELGRRCARAWAYVYLEGRRDPDVEWTEEMLRALPEGVTPRMRSAALGGATHKILEAWYHGWPVAWDTYPGQVAEAGRHLLPHPAAVLSLIEAPIGAVPLAAPADAKGPRVGFAHAGVMWAGFRDLVAFGAPELARLRIDAPDGVALFDHKTTASIGRYAKNAATLAGDLQCNLYALATMGEFNVDRVPARWVYYETKQVRRALPVDVTIERARAVDVVSSAAEVARTLDTFERADDAPQNPEACSDYGGCPHHVAAGGPCNAQRPIGKLIALRKVRSMALTEEQKAKFAAFRKTAPTPSETDAGEAEAPAGAAPVAPSQMALPGVSAGNGNGAAPHTESRPRGRPRKVPATPAPAPVHIAAVVGSLAEVIGQAQTEIAAAEHEIATATARRDRAIVSLKAALG